MKTLFTVTLIFTLAYQSFAQNILCREFGCRYDDLMGFLASRENVDVKLDQDNRVIATTSTFVVTYYFNEGTLYRLMLQKSFDKRKDAEASLEGFLGYFKLVNAENIREEMTETTHTLNVTRGNKIYEVILSRNASKAFEIRLTQFDMSMSPLKVTPTETTAEQDLYAVLLR